MRAIVLLCLLHAASGFYPVEDIWTEEEKPVARCNADQASCGCCLMKKQIHRMEQFFNYATEKMNELLMKSKMALDKKKDSRSAFSVALNNANSNTCFGPFSNERLITYQHAFLNTGGSYDMSTGIFTVPHSGVYSLAVTVYSTSNKTCASLQVNGTLMQGLTEKHGLDHEDSKTVIVTSKMTAGDQVSVKLPAGCFICDSIKHYNTFTGFLLYY